MRLGESSIWTMFHNPSTPTEWKCTLDSSRDLSLCYASQAHAARLTLAACELAFRLSGSLHDSTLSKQLLKYLVAQISMKDSSKDGNVGLDEEEDPFLMLPSQVSQFEPSLRGISLEGSVSLSSTSQEHEASWIYQLLSSCVVYEDAYEQQKHNQQVQLRSAYKGLQGASTVSAPLSEQPYAIMCSRNNNYHFFILVNIFTMHTDEPRYTLFDPYIHKEFHLDPGFYFFTSQDKLCRHLKQLFLPSQNPLLQARDDENAIDYFVLLHRSDGEDGPQVSKSLSSTEGGIPSSKHSEQISEGMKDYKSSKPPDTETDSSGRGSSSPGTPKRSRTPRRSSPTKTANQVTVSPATPKSTTSSSSTLDRRRSWIDQNLSMSPRRMTPADASAVDPGSPVISPVGSPNSKRRRSLSGKKDSSSALMSRKIDLLQSEIQELRLELERERQDRGERRELLRRMSELYETVSERNRLLEDRVKRLESKLET